MFRFHGLAGKEQVGEAASENLRREIGTAPAAERALSDDPGVGHSHDGCRDVFAAPFALHGVVANAGLG